MAPLFGQTRPALGFRCWPSASSGQRKFLVVDESEQFVAGDAVGPRGPITPAVRRFDAGLELSPGELGLALALNFQVVQKLQTSET